MRGKWCIADRTVCQTLLSINPFFCTSCHDGEGDADIFVSLNNSIQRWIVGTLFARNGLTTCLSHALECPAV